MMPVDAHIKERLTEGLDAIGDVLQADVVAVVSPIVPGLEILLRRAIEALPRHKIQLP